MGASRLRWHAPHCTRHPGTGLAVGAAGCVVGRGVQLGAMPAIWCSGQLPRVSRSLGPASQGLYGQAADIAALDRRHSEAEEGVRPAIQLLDLQRPVLHLGAVIVGALLIQSGGTPSS